MSWTYADLKSQIAGWMHRTDLLTVIPSFVLLVEARLNDELRVAEMEKTVTGSLTAEYTGLPSDFHSMRYVTGGGKVMQYQHPERLADQAANGFTPYPPIYTIVDMQIRVLPAPSVASPLTTVIAYYSEITPLVADTDTNWVLQNHPQIYLQGALVEACKYVKDPMWAEHEQRYQQFVTALRAQSSMMLYGGAIAVKAG